MPSSAALQVPRLYRFAIALAFALATTGASAGTEIHRCVEAGSVTYTDRGCGDNAQAVLVTVASVSGPAGSQGLLDREAPVTLGMSPRTVFDTLGRPRETIATLHGRQLVEYWLYRGAAGGVTRVAFQEGRVTGVHAR